MVFRQITDKAGTQTSWPGYWRSSTNSAKAVFQIYVNSPGRSCRNRVDSIHDIIKFCAYQRADLQ